MTTVTTVGSMLGWIGNGQIAAVFGALVALVAVLSLAQRVLSGARPAELLRTRFYEVAPLRALVHVVRWAFVGAAAVFAWRLLALGWRAAFGDGPPVRLERWAADAAGLVVGAGAAYVWSRCVVRIPDNAPPRVEVDDVAIEQGIGADALAALGSERFPNQIFERWRRALIARIVVTVVAWSAVGVLIADATGDAAGGRLGLRAAAAHAASWCASFADVRAAAVALAIAVALAAILSTNRHYLLLRFPTVVALALVGSAAVVAALAAAGAGGDVLLVAAGACAAALGVRGIADLRAIARHRAFRRVFDGVAASIRDALPGLAALRDRPDCALAPLTRDDVADRITRGCRVVEEADPFVTRNIARFLRLVSVAHEHQVSATLRYLTVDRYVAETGGAGTMRALQDPTVPAWNLVLFPLLAPAGYRNLLDPLRLASEWDRVSLCASCAGSGQMPCSACGGSGSVTRTETRTVGSGTTSQTVSETRTESCSTCGGTGRVTCTTCGGLRHQEFGRVLNTVWKRHMPTATEPSVPMPELMEDAEERVYFRVRWVEALEPVTEPAACDGLGPEVAAELGRAADTLALRHDEHARRVEEFLGGRLFRADFQVTGHRTLRIVFERLRGRSGWFFGARPEFHFPSIPFSWAKLATAAFLPPALLDAAPWVSVRVADWLGRLDAWAA